MVKKVNHQQFKTLIKAFYKQKRADGSKIPLIAYGTFGVGKSAVVRDTAIEIAEKKGKNFVDWNRITRQEKDKLFQNPKESFILMDIRLSEFDSSDIKGLPDFKKDSHSIEWKVPFWATILEHPESDGILFFDEINLATPLVISSVYKILHDRVINEGKINDNWLIIGCGNKDDDKAYTHELASPVRDRGGEVELIPPSADDWTEWAIKNNIDNRIIGFINWKSTNLHSVNYEDGQKFTTERGWARLNTLIKDVTDYQTLDLISSSAIGEGIAREFIAFCKIKDIVNLEDIIKNPEELKKITEVSMLYFIIGALAERYKDNKLKFTDILKISEVLDNLKKTEFVPMFWRLCSKYNVLKFRNDWASADKNSPLIDKFYSLMF